jgi:hypothetical protein
MMDIRIEYHRPDSYWFAGFLRNGESFILNGALVGTGPAPDQAVGDLIEQASFLVINGENDLIFGPIDIVDRIWLFKVLDQVLDHDQEARYAAMRQALGQDPYTWVPPLRLVTPEEDLAINMPAEIDPEQVVTPMTDDEVYHLWDDFADQGPETE